MLPASSSPHRRLSVPLARPRRDLADAAFVPPAIALPRLRRAFGASVPRHGTLDQLLRQMRCHVLAKGPVSAEPAGQPPSWWLVLAGRIVVGRPGANGDTLESRMVEPGQWFDLASAWLGSAWIESAICPAPVTLGAVPLQALLDCAREDDQLLRGMGQAMAEHVRLLTEGRHELATKDVLGRLALWLLRQPREASGQAAAIRLPVQKRSIARQLVMAQATLSRCFRRLVELGCIEVSGYTVTVRDMAALRALAGEQPLQTGA